jgi:hypothetical protein
VNGQLHDPASLHPRKEYGWIPELVWFMSDNGLIPKKRSNISATGVCKISEMFWNFKSILT